MTSSGSSVDDALAAYAAGRMTAAELASRVAAMYYGDGGAGTRDGLQPLMDIIERAHPGIVELSGSADRPGFVVRLAERPFPPSHEAALRQAVKGMVAGGRTHLPSPVPRPGFFARIVQAIRRVFRAT